jgi:hypothetical protein
LRRDAAISCGWVEDEEFVPGEPREQRFRRQHGFQPLADGDEQLVAPRMAETIVDVFQAVDVKEEHRNRRIDSQRHAQTRYELESIRQAVQALEARSVAARRSLVHRPNNVRADCDSPEPVR